MRKHSKKRGFGRNLGRKGMDDKIMFLMWEMLAIAMVALILIMAVRGIANNTTYWKKYHSTDLSLMTDLMVTNQGDFKVNYNLKEMHSNWVTNMLFIDKLSFQIFLKDDSYQVYDKSSDNDRFPQSFIFANTPQVHIVNSNVTRSYITILKDKDSLSMGADDLVISCQQGDQDNKKDSETAKFRTISMSNAVDTYESYINTVLSPYGRKGTDGQDNELLIVLTQNYDNTIIYSNPDDPLKSGRIACLIKKNLFEKYPEKTFDEIAYDKSLDETEPFKTEKSNYKYWVIVSIKKDDVSKEDLGAVIDSSIKEYYGW